jgi:hypothetical protein
MADMIRTRAVLLGVAGLPGLFTAYHVGSTPATNAEGLEAATRVRALFENFKTHMSSSVSVQYSATADVLDSTTGTITGGLSFTQPVTTVGTLGTSFIATPAQYLLRYLTSSIINGRHVRGRSFIGPCMVSDATATGQPSLGVQSALQAAGALLGTTVVTPIAHVVWHRPVNHAGGAAVSVVSYGAGAQYAVLRSRRD